MTTAATPTPGAFVEPNRPLSFDFEGRTVPALAGQTLAAALYAAGMRTFSRSFKYHRPRGLFCVSGDCPNCLMEVDGRPNVRTCVEPVRGGEVVRYQNAWPSLGFDLLRVFDRLDRWLPVGFYYRRFYKPRWLWPLYERALRRVAGLGRVDVEALPETEGEVEHLFPEVCVVGGGPAGLAAAHAAAEAGASVLLLEAQRRVGGHLLYEPTDEAGREAFAAVPQEHARLRVLVDTTAFGLYEGNLLGAVQRDRLLKVRARQVIVCTGGRQQPFLFHNNDLPGIFLGRGVQRLAALYGVSAGRRAVVLTDDEAGHALASQLTGLGIEVAAVVDRRAEREGQEQGPTGPVLSSSTVLAARGGKRLKGVRVAPVNAAGQLDEGGARWIACDLLCMASCLSPANELLRQGGLRFRHENGCWVTDGNVPGLFAAGAAAGTLDVTAQVLEGRLRGGEAAAALGHVVPELEERRRRFEARVAGLEAVRPVAAGQTSGRKCFVCLCDDVTEKDLARAVAEGFDHVETLKRYATVGMGPCQGKVCGQRSAEVCARLTDRPAAVVGTTTSRPPVVPVELGVLAAERHQPVRRTPMHYLHQNAGARWMDAGTWKRPESYGDPAAEVRAVRTGVGLIDVSTLGKIEILGPDAAELLDRVYLNKWSDLKPGRVRYGVMCDEDGVLFDDGVGARLGPDHFYLTATTGNAEAVYQWLELWRAAWRLNATVLNQTSAVAAVNVAGPRAREVLAKVSEMDLSAGGFPYLAIRDGQVAGVASRVLRIGFVGELGYEIHCSSAHGWHLWKSLSDAGLFLGLKPFGVEAQRILRLEKGHLLLGQDTDALSTPLEAGMEKLVRFEKPAFHGREPLLRLKERGPRWRLVGFRTEDGSRPPAEGCQVVEQGRPAGRVTSARHSPTLDQGIGLAWVPAGRSAPGERFLVRSDDGDVPAVVTALPFYDPEGRRLKV